MSCFSTTVQPTRTAGMTIASRSDGIAQLLQIPGAVSFMAYRTCDGASPNTIAMVEFR